MKNRIFLIVSLVSALDLGATGCKSRDGSSAVKTSDDVDSSDKLSVQNYTLKGRFESHNYGYVEGRYEHIGKTIFSYKLVTNGKEGILRVDKLESSGTEFINFRYFKGEEFKLDLMYSGPEETRYGAGGPGFHTGREKTYIRLAPDGRPRQIRFQDIDSTLLQN